MAQRVLKRISLPQEKCTPIKNLNRKMSVFGNYFFFNKTAQKDVS